MTRWHGKVPTGADLRVWRNQVGLYQQEVASLLNVDVTTLVRAEQSESPSSRIVYGVELLRSKIENGAIDLRMIKRSHAHRSNAQKAAAVIGDFFGHFDHTHLESPLI
jgi:hypothetical protein